MTRLMRFSLLLLAFAALARTGLAGNWDRFRGPNGTGTVDDKDVPVTFGTSENVVWKAPVPGNGNGSPVIRGKHLFMLSASKDGKERALLCLDTTDGSMRWKKTRPPKRAWRTSVRAKVLSSSNR